ncbi:zinc-dependent alcohol dehydrogenase family protein [Emcibacter sp.]|uniref:zinc-dependent alcohol dehydrogenase family protein n=1 Tax=Emcibacter sp. TaxID=1979954 RepID=UPI002AA8D863|nr:zinc-dependent alcohol dehydrogenase family protein [Emcibacter sp.]
MRAMILKSVAPLSENPAPLELVEWPDPVPGAGEVLIGVSVCGICHTELDEIEGRTPPPYFPMIPGHQVVGHIEAVGEGVPDLIIGGRVGVAWIYSACGTCRFCLRGEENLCPDFRATGRDANGGYAELMTVPASFTYPIPDLFGDAEAAPLLCAGAIGYRSLRLTGLINGQNLGLTGFGASAHLVLQMVRHSFPDTKIFVFARQEEERAFARNLGAHWAGDTMDHAPEQLHAVIDTTPAWLPIVAALQNLEPGGRVVINAIRKEAGDKEALLRLEYPEHLWMEKEIKSVANITRTDVQEFLKLAAEIPLQPEIREYPLEDANKALLEMKNTHIKGAKVLRVRS